MKIHPGKNSFLLFFLAFITFTSVYSQVPRRVISTLSMATAPHANSKGGYIISFPQSIGQSSVTGKFNNNFASVRQGFIQPGRINKSRAETILFDVDIYPNPFTEEIVISFPDLVSERVFFTLYDLQGRILYSREYAILSEIRLTVNSLPAGFYILKIKTGNKILTRKIVKTLK